MSNYTTELRYICESLAGKTESADYNEIAEIIHVSAPKIFSFDYPIFDENYREMLQEKIIKHFYTREICMETYGLWKLKLDSKMNEIMPYYNQLYNSQLLDINPLYMVNYTKSYQRLGNETEDKTSLGVKKTDTSNAQVSQVNSKSNDSNTNWNLYSETPQGNLNNVSNEAYLTNARKNTDSGSGESSSGSVANNTYNENAQNNTQDNKVAKTLENYIESVKGVNNNKSESELLLEFRKTFLNIDDMILKDLNELFFVLW